MNYKTNFYGAIGLASTIGKHGFALGQVVSEKGRDFCHYVSPNIDITIRGHLVLEKLGNACEEIRKFDKSATATCQE
jgi:hypothetical protein